MPESDDHEDLSDSPRKSSRSHVKRKIDTEESLDSSPVIKVTPVDFRETPMKDRNKKMRKKAPPERRSSMSKRGKRLTNIIDNESAAPHIDISPEEFYKHLDNNMSDADRMKQLLLWCANRQLEKSNEEFRVARQKLSNNSVNRDSDNEELTSMNIAKSIEEELLRDLSSGKISTAWTSRSSNNKRYRPGLPMKPNAQNIANLENYEKFEKRLKELEQEKHEWDVQWEKIQQEHKLRLTKLTDLRKQLSETAQEARQEAQGPLSRSLEDGLANLENTLMKLDDYVSRIEATNTASSMYIDAQQAKLAAIAPKHETSETPFSDIDVLRALSRCK